MFDSETVRLIQGAESLPNVDLDRLPQILTEAYATVVAARLGAIELGSERPGDEWTANAEQLRGLADTYEGLAIFLPSDDPHRASCAFVAASAHHTLSQARIIEARLRGSEAGRPSLTDHGIGPEVSACLLFLLAGQHADAADSPRRTGPCARTRGRGARLRARALKWPSPHV